MKALHALRALGIRIALDDFGTGYSSLSYLQKFPFDKIKIDQSFIQALLIRPGASAVIRAITDLATALGMETTAEGVEETLQLRELEMHGCSSIQGFLFSKPIRASEIAALLDLPALADRQVHPAPDFPGLPLARNAPKPDRVISDIPGTRCWRSPSNPASTLQANRVGRVRGKQHLRHSDSKYDAGVADAVPAGQRRPDQHRLGGIVDVKTQHHGVVLMLRVVAMLDIAAEEVPEAKRDLDVVAEQAPDIVHVLARPALPNRRRLAVAAEDLAFLEMDMDRDAPSCSFRLAVDEVPDFDLAQRRHAPRPRFRLASSPLPSSVLIVHGLLSVPLLCPNWNFRTRALASSAGVNLGRVIILSLPGPST